MKKTLTLVLVMLLGVCGMLIGCSDEMTTKIELESSFSKLTYYEGEDLDLSGGKLKVTKLGVEESMDITSDMVSGFDSDSDGQKIVKVKFMVDGVEFSTDITINIVGLKSIEVKSPPLKTEYLARDNFNREGLKVEAIYNDDVRKEISDITINKVSLLITDTFITVTYRSKSVEIPVTVKENPFTETKTAIKLAIGLGDLRYVDLDQYNTSKIAIDIIGAKTIKLQAELTKEQIAMNAELIYILYTNDGVYNYHYSKDKILEINIADYNGLESITAFVSADYPNSSFSNINLTNSPTGTEFNGDKYVGIYKNSDDTSTIQIVKNIDNKYESYLPNASGNELLGGTAYKPTWTEFNKDRVTFHYDENNKLFKTEVAIHASKSIAFEFDEKNKSFTALADGKYMTKDGLVSVFLKGTIFTSQATKTINAGTETDFKQAIVDAKVGDTVKLTANLLLNKYVLIEKNIIIDGGGFTLDGGIITDTQNFRKHIITIQGARVTVKNIVLANSDRAGINIYAAHAELYNVKTINCRLNGFIVNSSDVIMDKVTSSGSRDGAVDLSPLYSTAKLTVTDSCQFLDNYQIRITSSNHTATVIASQNWINSGTLWYKPTVYKVATEQELNDKIATNRSYDIIELKNDIELTSTLMIDRAVVIDGKGFSLYQTTRWENTDLNSKHLVNVINVAVTISNITLKDCKQGSGLNIYDSYYKLSILKNVEIINCIQAGLIVNSANVTASNLKISSSGWGSVNIDIGTNMSSKNSKLIFDDTCSFEDKVKIWSDKASTEGLVIEVFMSEEKLTGILYEGITVYEF